MGINYKLCGLLMMFLLFTGFVAMSQSDPQFSQYMFNPLYINPATAGISEEWNVHAFYRNQWAGINGAPKTYTVSGDGLMNERVGLGAILIGDQAGAENNTALYLNYAYRIPFEDTKHFLSIGIGGGLAQYRLDGSKLDPNDVPDPVLLQARKTLLMPDARAGAYYRNGLFYAGLSVDNLVVHYLKPKRDPGKLIPEKKMHWYLTAGRLMPVAEDIVLKPSFLLKDDLAGPGSLDLNVSVLFKELFWVGASYRTACNLYNKKALTATLRKPNAFVALTEVYMLNKLRIGYAYDISLSGGSGAFNRPTHEISLGVFLRNTEDRKLTPVFF